jgi:transposase
MAPLASLLGVGGSRVTRGATPSRRCRRRGRADPTYGLGLLLYAIVHSAGIQDRDGGIALLATLFGRFPFLEKLFADSAYQGPIFGNALAKIPPCLETEIVKRSDQAKGFVQLPKRWIVERTIAWLNRCRRLAKDLENLNRNALAFLKLASIRLMLRKLCNPC